MIRWIEKCGVFEDIATRIIRISYTEFVFNQKKNVLEIYSVDFSLFYIRNDFNTLSILLKVHFFDKIYTETSRCY